MKNIKCINKYLSQNLAEFPFKDSEGKLLFLHKGTTGCGGTTFAGTDALKHNHKVLVLMPNIPAVRGKQFSEQFSGCEGVQFLYGPHHYQPGLGDLVFSTYDKIKTTLNYINKEEWFVVLDEYHIITQAKYRSIMKELVDMLDGWKGVILMTATPDQYLINVISQKYIDKDIDSIDCSWDNDVRDINAYELDGISTRKAIIYILREALENNKHAYIMYSNLSAIGKIIDSARLRDEDYYILCSKNLADDDYDNVDRALTEMTWREHAVTIDEVNVSPRPITFLTSVAFEGVDIYDKLGTIFIVMDCNSIATIYEPGTIKQQCGRIRNNTNTVNILYKKFQRTTPDAYYNSPFNVIGGTLAKMEQDCKAINEGLPVHFDVSPMYLDKNGVYRPEPYEYNHFKRIYDNLQNCYSFNEFCTTLTNTGNFNIVHKDCFNVDKDSVKCGAATTFKKEVAAMYHALQNGTQNMITLHNRTLIEEAFNRFGADEVYKRAWAKGEDKWTKAKLTQMLKFNQDNIVPILGLHRYMFYPTEEILRRIKKVGEMCGEEFDVTDRTIKFFLTSLGYTVYRCRCMATVGIDPATKEPIRERVCGFKIIAITGNTYTVQDALAQTRKFWHNNQYTVIYNSLYQLSCQNLNVSMRLYGSGAKNPDASNCSLSDVLNNWDELVPEKKDQILWSPAYNANADDDEVWNMCNDNFTHLSCVVLDIDNGAELPEVQDVIASMFGQVQHIVHDSASSTPDHRKYRVILPLDKSIEFNELITPKLYNSWTKYCFAPELQDNFAPMWFFRPSNGKQPEVYNAECPVLTADALTREILNYNLCRELNKNVYYINGLMSTGIDKTAVDNKHDEEWWIATINDYAGKTCHNNCFGCWCEHHSNEQIMRNIYNGIEVSRYAQEFKRVVNTENRKNGIRWKL